MADLTDYRLAPALTGDELEDEDLPEAQLVETAEELVEEPVVATETKNASNQSQGSLG